MITEAYYTKFFQSEADSQHGDSTLSVLISSGSFQFAVISRHNSEVNSLCHVQVPVKSQGINTEQLSFLLDNFSLPGRRFSAVNIALLHTSFTMMPAAFSETADLKSVLGFTGTLPQDANTARHKLGDFDFCFSNSSAVIQLLERSFSNCSIRHAGAVNIGLLLSHHALQRCNVFLNIHDGLIELTAREGNTILFYNVYAVSGDEDVLYYLLFMAEQLKLQPADIILGVAGVLPVDQELMKHLRKFTGTMLPVVNAPGLQYNGKIAGLPSHYYFTLLNQHLCEL